jgi:hypothetical protein
MLPLTAGGGTTGLGLRFALDSPLTLDITGADARTGSYGEQIFAPGFSATVSGAAPSGHNTDRVSVAPAAGALTLTAARGGARALSMTANSRGTSGVTTWEITGTRSPGSRDRLTLPSHGKPVTLSHSGPPANLTVALRHVGGYKAPTLFTAKVHLRSGEQLKIRHPSGASGASRVLATIVRGKRTRRIALRNRARRPTARIVAVTATGGARGRSVVVRIATRGAGRGKIVAALRLARPGTKRALTRASATVKRSVMRISLHVPAGTRRRARAFVYVTVLAASGRNSSRTSRRLVTLR